MPKIVSCYGLWLECVNDNALMMVPMWDGMRFEGYQPVKGGWKKPDNCETFIIS